MRVRHVSMIWGVCISVAVLSAGAGQARAQAAKQMTGGEGLAMLNTIADAVLDNPDLKPLTRKALHPADPDAPMQFMGQDALTRPLLQAYLDRSVVHMNEWGERSRAFYRDTGTKFVHWADLGWARLYTPADWETLTAEVDAIHETDWGADMLFVAGVMEAVCKQNTTNTKIPAWLMTILEGQGIQELRTFGPNGPDHFNYEAMFDRNAPDWPAHFIGLWVKTDDREQGPPDITMLETQLYYAYLIAEHLDAGFEGIMFGQAMMTGARDTDNGALHALCAFANRWAAERAYRKAVVLTSHIIEPRDYPKAPHPDARPLFTHITWPTRMSYTELQPFGMHFGPDAVATETRQGGEEIIRQLELHGDLPILLEIDNYGKTFGPSSVADEGWDEITAYAMKPAADRRAFLRHYYFASRDWKDREGRSRVHIALPGKRYIHAPASLDTDADGNPLPPVSIYVPYRENGGDEEVIVELFREARGTEAFE
jgi:hypothetical protein